ncbi:UvrD-helicase domain-containing protein [Kitasatospora sp. NPDC057223]|uniref:UvrD-helicase domain-containing protein n=1 Tax=Kitasatospora sp. NPDC057223 TaxID=3346055 RepID=UPI00362E3124
MPTLGLHKDFLREFARLEKKVRTKVADAFDKFEHSSATGQHLEKLNHGRDPRLKTIRIDKFYRGVVLAPDGGDSFLLLKVLPHDDAIDWALKHRATVNTATEGIELRNDIALEQLAPGLRRAAEGSTAQPLFARVSDADLTRLGIDGQILPIARRLDNEEMLDALRAILPEHQYDVLFGLAAGMSTEDVWREIVQTQRTAGLETATVATVAGTPQDDLTAAMSRAQGRITLVSGPAELMELLERPFDAWRIFLHPSQHRIAYRPSYNGPARVTGGPGTGKTVVALHRAAQLAAALPPDTPDGAVLLTTFTRDLAAELQRSLHLLVTDPEQRRRVRVVNIDALAAEVLRGSRGHGRLSILTDQRDVTARWGRITRRLDLDHSAAFLDQEWRHVILAQGISTAEQYLKASRAGRGTALGPLKRAQVWRAVTAFTDDLRASDTWTFHQVCDEAARILTARGADGGGHLFRHVLVDEAQDLHPAQWRLLRAATEPGRPDDLFIAGDPHQRIYGNKVSLRSMGIHITGRSHRLRINYRSTHEIVAWATALLAGEPADDMDGGDDGLGDYRSAFHGSRPVTAGHPTKAAELDALVGQVSQWLTAAEVPAGEIGIAVRFVQFGRDVAAALTRAGIPATVMGSSPTANAADAGAGVRIGTMHRLKGLEFRCMAVAGVCEGTVPMRNALTPVEVDAQQHREDVLGELSLLFVACTRAREALYVSWHGAASPFLTRAAAAQLALSPA